MGVLDTFDFSQKSKTLKRRIDGLQAKLEKDLKSGKEEDLLDFCSDILQHMSPEDRTKTLEKLKKKDQVVRFQRYTDIQTRLLMTGKPLVVGKDIEEEISQLQELISHAEHLWEDACRMFAANRYATALFLSIVCIEEVGKIGVARLQILINERCRSHLPVPSFKSQSRKKNPFYSHPQKHILAAGAGALVNSRLDRILGLDNVIKFLDDVEHGGIERLRQSCLYVDHNGKKPFIPEQEISEKEALFHVVLAGEILAEVLGFEPNEWKRLLNKVKIFEVKNGLESAQAIKRRFSIATCLWFVLWRIDKWFKNLLIRLENKIPV